MPRKNRHVFVYNKTKETFLAFRVTVADSILSRLVGLLGKRSLHPTAECGLCPQIRSTPSACCLPLTWS